MACWMCLTGVQSAFSSIGSVRAAAERPLSGPDDEKRGASKHKHSATEQQSPFKGSVSAPGTGAKMNMSKVLVE
jgi:hypothetical protein